MCAFRPVGLYLSPVAQTSPHWAYWHPSNHSRMKTYFGGERERECGGGNGNRKENNRVNRGRQRGRKRGNKGMEGKKINELRERKWDNGRCTASLDPLTKHKDVTNSRKKSEKRILHWI